MTLTLTENKSKRRDKLVIMAEIVDLTRKGLTKTRIMFEANLSYSQLNEYLSILSETGLIEKFSFRGQKIFKATNKGKEFVEKQYQIITLLNEHVKYSVKSPIFKLNLQR